MTFEEIAVAALTRCSAFGGTYPTTRSVLYRRAAVRTAQLQAMVAQWNPNLAATTRVAPVTTASDGVGVVRLDNADVFPTLPIAVLGVRIADPGATRAKAGAPVDIYNPDDPAGTLPPRVVVEDNGRTLRAVDDPSFADVASVSVRYVPTPAPLAELPGTVPPLPQLALELLVIDLAKTLAHKGTAIAADVRDTLVASLGTEESGLLSDYAQQVASFTPFAVDRFAKSARLPDSL